MFTSDDINLQAAKSDVFFASPIFTHLFPPLSGGVSLQRRWYIGMCQGSHTILHPKEILLTTPNCPYSNVPTRSKSLSVKRRESIWIVFAAHDKTESPNVLMRGDYHTPVFPITVCPCMSWSRAIASPSSPSSAVPMRELRRVLRLYHDKDIRRSSG